MLRDLKTENEDIFWQKFNAGRDKQKWYYESLVESLKDLEGIKMYKDFKLAVTELFDD
jgi:hypothetical protein